MENENNPAPGERNFTDLKDRLNDREPRVPQEDDIMDREKFLDKYPREAINDDVMDQQKIKAVRQRVIAEVNEDQNEEAVETTARQQLEKEDFAKANLRNKEATAPRDADHKAAD